MLKAIIFDLDGTLYNENDYACSGFMHVTSQLYDGHLTVFNKLWRFYNESLVSGKNTGNQDIFDRFLRDNGMYSKEKVMEMVYLYRSHTPKIKPFDWVLTTLDRLSEKKISTGIITNGKATVQSNKLKALGILNHISKYVITDIIGEKNWKPFPMAYKLMLNWLFVRPEESLYIDDSEENLNTANSLGMQTVRFDKNGDIPKLITERLI
jgi:putative hydrolase of the HAD superfamily